MRDRKKKEERNESISYTQNLLSSICVHRDFLMFTFFRTQ